jgi:hypothetical protein
LNLSDKAINILRWFILVSVVINILQATILFEVFERWFIRPWFDMNERAGGRVPAIIRDERVHRFWALFMAVLFSAIWWYLGTPAGAAILRKSMH